MYKRIIAVIATFLSIPSANGGMEYPSKTPYYIQEAAGAFRLSPALLVALCTQESRCRAKVINRHDGILQPNGKRKYNPSYGLFQLKIETAKALGYQGPAKGLLDPEINAFYAAKLLRQNLDKYHSTAKAVSAHNAGHYIKSNKEYVHNVLATYAGLSLDKGIK